MHDNRSNVQNKTIRKLWLDVDDSKSANFEMMLRNGPKIAKCGRENTSQPHPSSALQHKCFGLYWIDKLYLALPIMTAHPYGSFSVQAFCWTVSAEVTHAMKLSAAGGTQNFRRGLIWVVHAGLHNLSRKGETRLLKCSKSSSAEQLLFQCFPDLLCLMVSVSANYPLTLPILVPCSWTFSA
jgi:hypothetical protein